jgi:hypothetical protein
LQGWDDLYLGPMNEPGFLDQAKAARALAEEAKLAKEKRVRDEAFAQHVLLSGRMAAWPHGRMAAWPALKRLQLHRKDWLRYLTLFWP